jgi:thiol-disulfide isomerase/thioredoxin
MKRFITTIGIAVLLGLFAKPETAHAQLDLGADIPMKARSMKAVPDGNASIASVKGEHGTVVVFWCNTCPWVGRYESRFADIAKAFKAKGFGFIAVNPNDATAYPGDSFDEMKKQASAGSYSFPYVVDEGSEMAVAFGAKRTPQVFVFDAGDKLVYQGAIDDSPADAGKVQEAYLKDALNAIAAGESIALAETKAFGCTIKFQ